MPTERIVTLRLIVLWVGACLFAFLSFGVFFRGLLDAWLHTEEFSYGIMIPPLTGYLLWTRREALRSFEVQSWPLGLVIAATGCALQIEASLSGTLLISGFALVLTLSGVTGFLWGKRHLSVAAGPLALLILMVPLPSYVLGAVTWHLQSIATTVSGAALTLLRVPVYQDGNLLTLPNYVLEVKQACSGSRSVFALIALSCVLGLSTRKGPWLRIVLVLVAPILATGTNVIRIVGTGLIAREWGSFAANESLHIVWGVAAFLMAVMGLLVIHRLLGGTTCKSA
jgi:exosortase